jgi:nuclear cap-binding protein subunit 2
MGLIVSKDTLRLCFVEYIERKDALAAVACLSSTKLDGKIICVELDALIPSWASVRTRGISGGQVRDDRRSLE